MSAADPKALVVWLRGLDRLLTRGSSSADLDSLAQALSHGPENWYELSSRARGWRKLPCWARVFANTHAESSWIIKAVSLCTTAGAVHDALVVGKEKLPESVFMALTDRLGELNAQAYTRYTLARLGPDDSPDISPSYKIAWLGRLFSESHQWKSDSVSPRVVVWQFLEAFPDFRSSPLAEKVWAIGLGLTGPDTYAPRAVEFAAMNGLDGNVVLRKQTLPSVSLKQWPTQDLGPWREAPAWGWALLRNVFRGSRMLVREVQEGQPSPWDPNALLPDGEARVGDWLLSASLLPSRPASSSGAMIMELDELGFEWGHGPLGKRPIDALQSHGLGPGILGRERWSQVAAQAEEALMDTALPEARGSKPSRGRL